MQALWRRVRSSTLRPSGTGGFLVVAVVVGVGSGVGAALLVWAIELVAALALGPDPIIATKPWVLVTIPAGMWAAWFLADRLAPEVRGDGVPEVIASLALRGGHIRSRVAGLKLAATALTVGSGGSAGREGPIVQIGASIGSTVARWLSLGEDQVRTLVAAGAGAGIGASFNAPIAGIFFATEVILRRYSIRHLNAVVVASVAAAVTSRSLVGEEIAFVVLPHRLADWRELFPYTAMSLLAVGAALLLLRSIALTAKLRNRLPVPLAGQPIVAGLAVAGAALVASRMVGDESLLTLGTGQEFIGDLLRNDHQLAWGILGFIAVLKIVTTAFTFAGRGSGGAFMPSLFIGASIGAGFAQMIAGGWGISRISPGAFALVGMAATFAAVARAPLTSILIVFEVTGDYGLVLPLMLASSLATLLAERVHRESVYTMPLARMNVRLSRGGETDLLDTVTVGEVMSRDAMVASPGMTTAQVQSLLDRHRSHGLPVVDDGGSLVGVVSITDITRHGGPSDEVLVRHAMTSHPVTVTPSSAVSTTLERMAGLGVGRVPVVAEDDPRRLVGMFRREHAIQAYHHALAMATGEAVSREELRRRTAPGTAFFEFRIPPGCAVDGAAIRDVAWPEGCTLVSVQRARDVLVPAGPTVLHGGDLVTAFGGEGIREQIVARLAAPPRDPAE